MDIAAGGGRAGAGLCASFLRDVRKLYISISAQRDEGPHLFSPRAQPILSASADSTELLHL